MNKIFSPELIEEIRKVVLNNASFLIKNGKDNMPGKEEGFNNFNDYMYNLEISNDLKMELLLHLAFLGLDPAQDLMLKAISATMSHMSGEVDGTNKS